MRELDGLIDVLVEAALREYTAQAKTPIKDKSAGPKSESHADDVDVEHEEVHR